MENTEEKSFEGLLLESVKQHQLIMTQLLEQNKMLAAKIERLETQIRVTLADVGVVFKVQESLTERVAKLEFTDSITLI